MSEGAPPPIADPLDDRAVRSWRRRPLLWLAAGALIGSLFVLDERDIAAEHEVSGPSTTVVGEVLPSWDGGRVVPVRYRPAGGGDAERALAFVPADTDLRVGAVDLRVGDDPAVADVVGVDSSHDLVGLLALVVPGLLALLGWWASRRRCVARSRALLACSGPGYAMVGVPRHGRLARRRWHLDLYALDARPGGPPVASVPVIAGERSLAARPVVVHGTPRPGAAAVPIEEDGRTWWPAGRASLGARRPLPDPGLGRRTRARGRSRWLLLLVGIVLLVVSLEADDREAVVARSEPVEARVVEGRGAGVGAVAIAYEWDGRPQLEVVRLAGPQVPGDHIERRVDPDHPERTWQPDTEYPPTGSGWGDDLFTVAIAAIWVGWVWAAEPRGWDGTPLT